MVLRENEVVDLKNRGLDSKSFSNLRSQPVRWPIKCGSAALLVLMQIEGLLHRTFDIDFEGLLLGL